MADKRITSRTKVYITRIGLKDWVVAVDSQKAALKAWDVHRNLFETGEARVTSDPAHVELAMRTPGVPVAASGRPTLPETGSNVVKLPVARKPAGKSALIIDKPKPKVDRSKLDAAEEELRAFEREATRQRSELARRKLSIETEIEAFEAEASRRRERLVKRVARERAAYEDAS